MTATDFGIKVPVASMTQVHDRNLARAEDVRGRGIRDGESPDYCRFAIDRISAYQSTPLTEMTMFENSRAAFCKVSRLSARHLRRRGRPAAPAHPSGPRRQSARKTSCGAPPPRPIRSMVHAEAAGPLDLGYVRAHAGMI